MQEDLEKPCAEISAKTGRDITTDEVIRVANGYYAASSKPTEFLIYGSRKRQNPKKVIVAKSRHALYGNPFIK